jgi:glycosyltransferase involved in cell wall biosynthesis
MRNPPVVTLIVPVYNAGPHLVQCLDSVLGQTFTDVEVILVNDGSVDGSGALCDRYAASDPRFRVIHQGNQGPARARNRALDEARGRFVALIDADDWLDAAYLECLVGVSDGQDLVVCGYAREHPAATETQLLGSAGALARPVLLEHTFCTALLTPGCWNKLLRRDLIEANRLRFVPDMPWGDDMLFLAQYYRFCKHIRYVDQALYHYRLNPASLMKAVYARRVFRPEQGRILDALDAMQVCFDLADPVEADLLGYRRVRSSVRLLLHLAICRHRDAALLAGISRQVRAGYAACRRSPHASRGERLAAAVIRRSPRLAYYGVVLVSALLPGWIRRQLG